MDGPKDQQLVMMNYTSQKLGEEREGDIELNEIDDSFHSQINIEGDESTPWLHDIGEHSLPEFNGKINVPNDPDSPWYKVLSAFIGPGALVAVGYMDPGNWSTDIAGGSAYG